jgi:glycosyltransferase involved in cell wall biosynthesis
LPDEVVVIVSPVTDESILNNIKNKYDQRLNLKIFCAACQLNAALSRDFLTQHITGDLILYHDADDYQHPQRVEIVKKFFENFDIVQLCHSYSYLHEGCAGKLDYNDISYVKGEGFYDRYFVKKEQVGAFGDIISSQKTHAGALCIKRELLEDIWWKNTPIPFQNRRAEDYWFNMQAFEKYNRFLLIDAPIYVYRVRK